VTDPASHRRAREAPPPTDAALVERMRDGDMSALGVLFDRYDKDVRRIIARQGVSPGDVDDLVQLTFLDALKSAANYDGRTSAKPWLAGMAIIMVRRHRRSVGRLRQRLSRWALDPADAPVQPAPDHAAEIDEEARRAARALADLTEKKREVFVLFVLEGLSGEEIAAALDIPIATVWTRLHHARRDLREALAEEGT